MQVAQIKSVGSCIEMVDLILNKSPLPIIYCGLLVLFISSLGVDGADNILYSGETLYSGNYLRYKTYTFVCQADCNLVLYENGAPIWASNTGGRSRNCYCTMQADGNFVVYAPGGRPIWASNTHRGRSANYVLILQKDRNVVIYGPALYATGTNVKGTKGVNVVPPTLMNNTTSTSAAAAVGPSTFVIAGPNVGAKDNDVDVAAHEPTYILQKLTEEA